MSHAACDPLARLRLAAIPAVTVGFSSLCTRDNTIVTKCAALA